MADRKQEQTLPAEAGFGGLTAAAHSGFGIETLFSREILLCRLPIVGMRFQGGADDLIGDLKTGSRIVLLREPQNRFDSKAIIALDEEGRKLGYIPRNENTILSSLMDAGKHLHGIVPYTPKKDTSGVDVPSVIYIDLFMSEFAMPGDPEQIPRQGYQGSYAVVELDTARSDEDELQIGRVCALRVINGEERGLFYRELKDWESGEAGGNEKSKASGEATGNVSSEAGGNEKSKAIGEARGNVSSEADSKVNAGKSGRENDEESAREKEHEDMIRKLQAFIGYLPVVVYDTNYEKEELLAKEWGLCTGKAFSNRVIDIGIMAWNHIEKMTDYSLENVAQRLGIEAECERELERKCRLIRRIYSRFDRSELEKKKDVVR